MNNYYENVIAEMQELFDEQAFSLEADGTYKNEKKSVKICFEEEKQMYKLYMADVSEGTVGEYTEVSAWLFDETQNAKDAASVGMDFAATVREKMGVKLAKKTEAQIDLPTFAKDGNYNVTALAKRTLDVFPQFKETYKAHIAKYGNFLYLQFFGEYIVPELTAVYSQNNKKTVKKVTEMLEDAYISGDREVVNTVVAVLCAAVCNDEGARQNLLAALGENAHMKAAIQNFMPVINKNKKIRKALSIA